MMRIFAQNLLGVRSAHAQEHAPSTSTHSDKLYDRSNRYSGVPAIPSDIGFSGGKGVGGKQQSGGMSQHIMGNPFVILGMGLTTVALLGMMKKSFMGDRLGAQKYMQYRIMAQFFTVTALVGGVAIFGATYEPTNKNI
ncbi:unnamed protein product [Bursaphelenchus xylophilus]|uniref:(pine wood nematode) hypothetical protein n=1 Tax=Bursaphelenchus xylophilus TaxID=6326 RepID=A0A1I7S4J1_BURXY|nr:unnamed protein product [Bursaphelenchus xylophilus]CAG9117159.1 unnamed protein product [Bursaphelenchus xylophilus]